MQVKPKNNINQKVDYVWMKIGDKKDDAWDIKEEKRIDLSGQRENLLKHNCVQNFIMICNTLYASLQSKKYLNIYFY